MMTHVFYAQYTGHCAHWCGEPIRINDPITYTVEDELVHADCLDKPRRPVEDDPSKACKTCHLIHPLGDCE